MPEELRVLDPPFIPWGFDLNPRNWSLLQHQYFGYEFWPQPGLAEIPQAVRPWGWDLTAFFWQKAKDSIDRGRTAALVDYECEIKVNGGHLHHGVMDGVPFQVSDTTSRNVLVQFQSDALGWLSTPRGLAFPGGKVRIQGDPAPGSTIDRHCILFNPSKGMLYEMISMRQSLIPFLTMGASYVATRGVVWDLKKPWNQTKGGVCAAQIPYLPIMLTNDDFRRGRIDHVMGLVMNNYGRERTGPARGGDGLWSGHPVRSGERLRVRAEIVNFWLDLDARGGVKLTPEDRIFLQGGREMGFIVMDKQTNATDGSGWGAVVTAQDFRLEGLTIPLNLSDLEVVAW